MRTRIRSGLAVAVVLAAGVAVPTLAQAQAVDQAACNTATAHVKKDQKAVRQDTRSVTKAGAALKSAKARQKKARTRAARASSRKTTAAATRKLTHVKAKLKKAKSTLAADREAAQQACTPGY